MYGRRAVIVGVVVAAVLFALFMAGGVAGAATVPVDGIAVQENDSDTDADRPLHENPAQASGSGDQQALSGRLASELEAALDDSTVQLSEGEYDRASELLGPEYRQRLEQYAEVAGEGSGTGADGTSNQTAADLAETLRTVSERQQNLSRTLRRYNETLAQYRAARDRGNATGTRTRARELAALTERVESLGAELGRRYEQLAAAGLNVTAERERLNATVATNTNTTEQVTRDAFVPTTLSVSADTETISYTSPLQVTGQLVDATGTPISGARIVIPDPAGATTTRTDEDGRFSLAYRPVARSIENETVPVVYRPMPTAPYQAAEQAVSVDITPTEGDLSITASPDTVRFGDELSTTARVTVDSQPVGGVELAFTVGEQSVRARTDDAGTATVAPNVTATIPAGSRRLRVQPVESTPAVSLEAATASVTVDATTTTLQADAATVPGGTAGELIVDGRLRTASGESVPNQSVGVLVDGELVATATTDLSGRFETTVAVGSEQQSVTLEVVYDEPTTNLAAARATTTVELGAGGDPAFDLTSIVAGGLALLIGGIALAAWHGWRPWQVADATGEEPTAATDDEETAPATPDPDVLQRATERVDTAPDEATALAYGTTRRALATEVDAADQATHWEFYQTCAADGLTSAQVDALETLTERYEDAVFSPAGVDSAAASEALAAAEQLAAEE